MNRFVARERRERESEQAVAPAASLKHVIEALGVPHTEVAAVTVDGEPAPLDARAAAGLAVAVYDAASAAVAGLPRPRPPRSIEFTRFVADAHLGGLAEGLRLAGFDTVYDNHIDDARVEALARDDGRIVLSRDRELLKRRGVGEGAYVHACVPDAQLREVVARFGLAEAARPFRLCLRCNAPLRALPRDAVAGRVPDGVLARQQRFAGCAVCGRVFWEGTHWARMRARIAAVLGGDAPPGEAAD